MRTTLALGLAVALVAPAVAEEKKFDPAKLQGNWEYKSGEKNGQKPSEEALKPKIKITKDTITVGEGDMLFEFKYTLDTTKDPVAIDMTMTKSPFNMELKAKGIIGFDGDDVKLCYNPTEGGDRPAKFDGAKAHYFVLKKAK